MINLEGLTVGAFTKKEMRFLFRRASHTPTREFLFAGHGGGLDRFLSASSDSGVQGLQQLENHLSFECFWIILPVACIQCKRLSETQVPLYPCIGDSWRA